MADLTILAFLIVTPSWLIYQWVRVRPQLDQKRRSIDPLTGALYANAQAEVRKGLSRRCPS